MAAINEEESGSEYEEYEEEQEEEQEEEEKESKLQTKKSSVRGSVRGSVKSKKSYKPGQVEHAETVRHSPRKSITGDSNRNKTEASGRQSAR